MIYSIGCVWIQNIKKRWTKLGSYIVGVRIPHIRRNIGMNKDKLKFQNAFGI